jgi:hypothetical protein
MAYYVTICTTRNVILCGPYKSVVDATMLGVHWSAHNNHDPKWMVHESPHDTLSVEVLDPIEAKRLVPEEKR